MIPVAITFADDKMMALAEAQGENVAQFGMKHEIFRLNDVESYDAALWIYMAEASMDAINRHGKIFRLDSEVRFHKPLPQSWLDNDNVFFQATPTISNPWFLAMNTGQMIIGRSGLEFCRIYRECMIAMIPPDADPTGKGHFITDEAATTFALRLSGVEYVQEYLDLERSLGKSEAANRGTWIGDRTILTHPTVHNWTFHRSGLFPIANLVSPVTLINHYQGDVKLAQFIVNLMLDKNDGPIWKKIANDIGQGCYSSGGWCFNPKDGTCAPEEYWPNHTRKLDHLP